MLTRPSQEDLDRWADDGGSCLRTTASQEMMLTITALTDQALARCDSLGIPWADFYQALLLERRGQGSVPQEMFQRAFRRLGKE
jgi:hypothetical protein